LGVSARDLPAGYDADAAPAIDLAGFKPDAVEVIGAYAQTSSPARRRTALKLLRDLANDEAD
jgi:hypothetical protein